MFPSEHPYSSHRNFIGHQRAAVMKEVTQKVAELRVLGYDVDADRMGKELSDRYVKWDSDGERGR